MALLAFDVAALLVVASLLSLGFAPSAYAYVDPSVMTYTIQALAGVAVALSAVAGVAFRRSRRAIVKALGIDENANKEVEPSVSRIMPSLGNMSKLPEELSAMVASKGRAKHTKPTSLDANVGVEPSPNKARKKKGYSPKWPIRFAISFIVTAFVMFSFLIVAPYEMIAGNESSLTYALADVWQIFVVPAVVCTLVVALVVSLLRGSVFNVVVTLLFGFGLASYVQTMLLNGTLPSADGATVDWTRYRVQAVVTFVVWVVIVIMPYVLSRLNRKLVQSAVSFLAAALIIVQVVGVTSLFISLPTQSASSAQSQEQEEDPYYYIDESYVVTDEGLFTVSEKDNIIVFVLDMYDTTDLQAALQADPDLLSQMTGFTWFQNTLTSITPTRDAVPSILTGQSFTTDMSYGNLGWYRWGNGPYLRQLAQAGYSVGAYTDTMPTKLPYIMDYMMNAVAPGDKTTTTISLNQQGAFTIMVKCALFRDLPWVFKPFFWFYTDDINQAMVVTQAGTTTTEEVSIAPYSIDDASLNQRLLTNGISATDTGEKGAFRFIHLMGAHYPYTLDENGQEASGTTTRTQQAIGSMGIVSEYLRQLKELGLYDSATIIITADHGYFESSEPFELLSEPATPVMLVKPAQSAEEAVRPLTTSGQPVSTLDIMPTALQNVEGIDVQTEGVNMLTLDDMTRKRVFNSLSKQDNGVEQGLVQYQVVGDALDISNWTPTGWIYRYGDGGGWEYRG